MAPTLSHHRPAALMTKSATVRFSSPKGLGVGKRICPGGTVSDMAESWGKKMRTFTVYVQIFYYALTVKISHPDWKRSQT